MNIAWALAESCSGVAGKLLQPAAPHSRLAGPALLAWETYLPLQQTHRLPSSLMHACLLLVQDCTNGASDCLTAPPALNIQLLSLCPAALQTALTTSVTARWRSGIRCGTGRAGFTPNTPLSERL